MRYRFQIVDVFASTAFQGNQLAVVPDAAGLSTEGMQCMAREFNFAESAFVTAPNDPAHSCRVRIFTPTEELPFAGHPTVGTACVLAKGRHQSLILEEGIGPVPVVVQEEGGVRRATFTLQTKADERPFTGTHADMAATLSLPATDVLHTFYASVGLPYAFARLRSREAVDRAQIDMAVWARVFDGAWSSNVFLFARDGRELYARMFAPGFGITEDPATGSACAALVGALASHERPMPDEFRLSILQGVAMGRRSEIEAIARTANGEVTSVSIGGATRFVAEGEIEVPAHFMVGQPANVA